MSTSIYIPSKGQFGNIGGSSLWFVIPSELQAAMNEVVFRASEDQEQDDRVQFRCDDIIDSGTNVKYSECLHIRVGSRRYGIYKASGVYRISANGNSFSKPFNNDQELILNYLRSMSATV